MMVRGNGGKMIIFVLAGVVALMMVGLGILAFKPKAKGHEKQEPKETSMIALGEFVVNLADTAATRYVKADVVLEVEGKCEIGGGGHGGEGEGDTVKPRLRDAVIAVMSSKRYAELAAPSGKEFLKKEIIKAANEHLPENKAVNVYFNDFAMQ